MPHTPLSPIAQEHNTKPVILCYYTIFPGRLVEDAGKKGRPVQMTLNIYSHVVDNRPEELLAGISAAFAPRPQMGQAVPPGSTP